MCTAVSVAAAVVSLTAAEADASERLYRARVMLSVAECKDSCAWSELAELALTHKWLALHFSAHRS